MFLNGHTGFSEAVQTQLLQICHLASSEEDFSATKLVLVRVLERKTQNHLGVLMRSVSNPTTKLT